MEDLGEPVLRRPYNTDTHTETKHTHTETHTHTHRMCSEMKNGQGKHSLEDLNQNIYNSYNIYSNLNKVARN